MVKLTTAVLRFKPNSVFHSRFILKLTSDKGFKVANTVQEAMLFTTKRAAESYLTLPKYAYFTYELEAVTIGEVINGLDSTQAQEVLKYFGLN